MKFDLNNQTFFLNPRLTVYHLCNGMCDARMLLKLKHICTKALADPKFNLKHCFEIDNWENKNSTMLFQFYSKRMNLVIMEIDGDKHAVMGYSIFGDIALCPRRVFVDIPVRNRRIYPVPEYSFGDVIMPGLEAMFIKCGVRYVAITFNRTSTGTAHFRTYSDRNNLRRVITRGNYFENFVPLSSEPINTFGSQQYVVYRKLIAEDQNIPDLTEEKYTQQIK